MVGCVLYVFNAPLSKWRILEGKRVTIVTSTDLVSIKDHSMEREDILMFERCHTTSFLNQLVLHQRAAVRLETLQGYVHITVLRLEYAKTNTKKCVIKKECCGCSKLG